VHLAQWPKAETADASILESMQEVRRLVTLGLEARQKAKIIVRQPLGIFNVKNLTLKAAYIEILQDELNVKNVSEKASLENEIELDTTITPELKREGDYRELVRSIQDLRKQTGLTPSDVIILTLPGKDKETIVGFEENLKKTVLAKEVEFGDELAVKKI
jgi:isoleucyl-tRNA synthetase